MSVTSKHFFLFTSVSFNQTSISSFTELWSVSQSDFLIMLLWKKIRHNPGKFKFTLKNGNTRNFKVKKKVCSKSISHKYIYLNIKIGYIGFL